MSEDFSNLLADIEPLEEEDEEVESLPGQRDFEFNIEWPKEKRDRLGLRIKQAITDYFRDTSERRDNQRAYRDAYECMPMGREGPWTDASEIPSDLTRTRCQAHTTRLNQQILNTTPAMLFKARDPESAEFIAEMEEAVTAHMEEARWQITGDQIHTELPVVANPLLRVTYEIETKRVPKLEVEADIDRAEALELSGMQPGTALAESLEKNPDGTTRKFLKFKNVVVHDGIRMRLVPWEDAIMVPASARSDDELYGIGERLMISGMELRKGANVGKYIESEVEELLQRPSDPPDDEREERLDHQAVSTSNSQDSQGFASDDDEEAALYREYKCFEVCWKIDANDDGEPEWCVVVLHEPTGRVLRLQYLPYEHGEAYYIRFPYFERPGELFSASLAEILAVYQDADTAVLQQLVDHGDLAINFGSNFFYDPNSGYDPDDFEIMLGRPQPIERPHENILQLKPLPLPAEHYSLRQIFKDMADFIAATSNPSLGKETDAQKTLGEVQIVTNAATQQFEEVSARVSRTWARVWDQVRWLLAQYGEGGMVKYRKAASSNVDIVTDDDEERGEVAGGQVFKRIPAKVLRQNVDIIPTGIAAVSDMASRVSQSTIVQQTLLAHPLGGQNPDVMLTALDVYLQALRYPMRHKIIESIQQQIDAERAVNAAEQESAITQSDAELAAADILPEGGDIPAELGPAFGEQ